MLVHVTNIPTPYRISFCNALHEALQERQCGFHVLYCAEREPDRHWEVRYDEMKYPWTLLRGISPRLGQARGHLNPGVVTSLRRLRPRSILIAGSWNMPTAILAASRMFSGPAFRVFWSEAHADAVQNPAGPVAWLRRRCLRAYDAFAVPNEASAFFLERQLGARPRIFPLPNVVDDEFYREARFCDRLQVRHALGVSPHATVFVCVAQLIDRKGVVELARAAQLLGPGDSSRCEVVFVGDGPLRHEIESVREAGKAPLRVTGHQDSHQVRKWLAAADAFILPTKWDPNPLTVIEAAFAGLPLLVSCKAGNSRELVREGESGMIIQSTEKCAIADVLARFMQLSENQRRQLSSGASSLAEAGFRRREVARNFVEAILAAQVQP